MSYPRRAALIRFLRGLAYAALSGGVVFSIDQLPLMSDVIPGGPFVIPVVMAALLALDKWVRARRAESEPAPS